MGKLYAEDYEEGHICLAIATQLFFFYQKSALDYLFSTKEHLNYFFCIIVFYFLSTEFFLS